MIHVILGRPIGLRDCDTWDWEQGNMGCWDKVNGTVLVRRSAQEKYRGGGVLEGNSPPRAQYLVHQSLAASRRHVAASYWTAASDVAATSAPVNAGHRRSMPPATGQRRRTTVVIGGQRRSSSPTTDLRWRSTTVAGGKPPLTAAGAGQRAGLGWSGSGPGRVRHMACHVSATCAHVSATCAHVASTW
nr:hypothetical protein [Tanacetum cinerariifolium]